MFAWSIRASACRSASNRASTYLLSMPALISLSATRRLTGSVCWAIQTLPMPPSPIGSISLYGPMSTPGASPGAGRGLLQETAGALVEAQQLLHLPAQVRLAGAGAVQKVPALVRVFLFQG